MATTKQVTEALRKLALKYPEANEGVVCDKSSFKAGKKGFFFMGVHGDAFDIKVKLDASLPEAEQLVAKDGDTYGVGGAGWTSATFTGGKTPPKGLMEKWIDESYRLLAPKKLVAQLPDTGPPK